MSETLIAAIAFVVGHLGLSSTPARPFLVRVLGDVGYLIAYSLVASVTLVWLIWTYADVPRFNYLWAPDPDLYWVAKIVMPFAFMLMVGGFMVSNPTSIGMASGLAREDAARGVLRITRHPLQWSVLLWALVHVVANGDTVSVIFFSAFAVLSGLGSALIDMRKARAHADFWPAYKAVTSNLPFAAVVAGRNRLVLRELWRPLVAGLGLYAAAFYLHESFSGVAIFL